MKARKTKKTSRKSIPDEIKRQVDQIVDDFNRATLRGDPNYYFKYSKDRYDPNEWFFPGAGRVDGTVEGAMRAGMEAYS